MQLKSKINSFSFQHEFRWLIHIILLIFCINFSNCWYIFFELTIALIKITIIHQLLSWILSNMGRLDFNKTKQNKSLFWIRIIIL